MFSLTIDQSGPFKTAGEEFVFELCPTKKEIVACCLHLLLDIWFSYGLGVCAEEISGLTFRGQNSWEGSVYIHFKNIHKNLTRILKWRIVEANQPVRLEQYLTTFSLGQVIKQWMKEELEDAS